MKNQFRRTLSLMLVVALMLSVSVPAFAEASVETTVDIWNVVDGTIRLTEEVKSTEMIIRQYDNGILTTAVHIPTNRTRSNTVVLTIETLDPAGEIIDTEYLPVETIQHRGTMSTYGMLRNLGTLRYSTSDGEKRIIVQYETNEIGDSTITLKSGTTKLATLVSAVVTIVGMATGGATGVVKWILDIMGITATAASFFFPGRTLSCEQIDYIYRLTNNSNSSHTNRFTSHYYYITDDRSENASYKGKSVIEGWTPSTAKSQTTTFAQTCYTYMFEGSYSVIGWV